MLVDRTPQIVLLAANADEHLVHVPLVAGLWPSPLQHLGEDLAEAQAPLADALPRAARISSISRRLRLKQ